MTNYRAFVDVISFGSALLVATSVSAAVIIDFDTYPDGDVVPAGLSVGTQWASLGVVFSDLNGAMATAVSSGCSLTAPNHVFGQFTGTVVATFVDPATGNPALTNFAGTAQDFCWVPGEGIAMRAYDQDGDLIDTLFNAVAGGFAAFSYADPIIARVEMDGIGQGIDNFQFNVPVPIVAQVPEPGSLGLALAGIALLNVGLWRRL